MSAKIKIELDLILPQGEGCQPCVERLESRIQTYRAIEVAHRDEDGPHPYLCVHYDPNLMSVDQVRAIAIEEGANLESRYQHEVLPVEGMDCADCARTLEGSVQKLDGVAWASVNFAASSLAVEYDSQAVERPSILARVRSMGYEVPEAPPVHEMVFDVDGLDCADCALHLEEALNNTAGVAEVRVDFTLARLRLTPQNGSDVRLRVEQVADDMGYSLRARGDADSSVYPEASGWWQRLWRRRRDLATVVSGVLIGLGVVLGLLGAPEGVIAGVFIAAVIAGGYFVARAGWAALRTAHSLDMNALMSIAAMGAVFVGEWAEGAVAVFLFSLGNTLESYTMDRARNAIRGLMDLSPKKATVLHGDEEQQVRVEELVVGDSILIRPGERIPMDGTILTGQSAVNQAPITGESVAVEKGPGDVAYAGTVNGQGALTVRVTRLAADTTIARIIRMVEDAQAQKAPAQHFVDRFAKVYTPAVIVVAAAVAILPPLYGWLTGAATFGALFNDWLYRALVLLVIACPCALVISTPVSIVSAIASAARNGVLIKGGVHLEALGSLRVMAFDKTGTLTSGKPEVVDIRCMDHQPGLAWADCETCRQMLAEAAAIERRSEHPLALAVVQAAKAHDLGLALPAAQGVRAEVGRGVRGRVGDHDLTVGTHTFIHESHPEVANSPLCDAVHAAQDAGQTVMVVRDDCCGVRGYIAVADTIRPGVAGVLSDLQEVGIEHTVMLTGDNEGTAQAIAMVAGVDEVKAGLLPEDKVTAIEALLDRYEAVAMVGDGVNDAPALARATVGIAMGAAGTDTALETADVALMADDLGRLPFAVELSRQARFIIRQNVAFSLGIKAVFLALALAGVATLWMAVFADVGASLIVTLNGMRLLRKR